ncbi:DUF1501 domain-containing protein [Synechococcus sp. ATX 2A4]|uniref:DUF1501 domain-containing protein n=1 Tax=Synechococcus sp. ATX 2A4 TaxID=2823727 RepID=UPI0020CD6E33|nr:DUF1501 domain-containing protein [Synechococcus sp. ATX 2A4]MCP9885573.1 DUF1501 domain-containing protein [Synechococcus sp. ATX 2A4]
MKRRSLLQLSAGFSAAALLDQLGAAASQSKAPKGKVFVLLDLRGGNDGLNTVGPHRHPLYLAARPRLKITDGFSLGPELYAHPALAPLKPAWRAGRLAFALGVGWREPNRSHFQAMDDWARGTPSPTPDAAGWLATAIRKRGSRGPLVTLGPTGAPALEGPDVISLQLNQASFTAPPFALANGRSSHANPVVDKILAIESSGNRELARLRKALAPLPKGVRIPAGLLGQQVAFALRLIGSGICPPVLQMALGGFDTHGNQLAGHAQQLRQLAEALATFDAALQRMPNRPPVTLLSTSEFGRRLQENNSGGTDHGSASVALLLGDQVPHPFIGRYPSLARLDDRGDLIPAMEPLELYRRALAL